MITINKRSVCFTEHENETQSVAEIIIAAVATVNKYSKTKEDRERIMQEFVQTLLSIYDHVVADDELVWEDNDVRRNNSTNAN